MPTWMTAPDEGERKLAGIRWLLLDVDGVMTDGKLYYGDHGEVMKAFHVHDGHGLKLWGRAGYEAGVITGRTSEIVASRFSELGVTHVYQGAKDKRAALKEMCAASGARPGEICYVGDELVDIPIFHEVALGVAVADALEEVRARADLVTTRPGGCGAVREVIEFILTSHGGWTDVTQRYYTDVTQE